MTHRIAILGASGYTGAELVRLIAQHPNMEIAALSGERKAGMTMAEVFPHLRHMDLPPLCRIEDMDFTGIDLCFCALPHKTSQEVIRDLPANLKIVDLSADFRLRDPAAYKQWYGSDHAAPEIQDEAVYGLTEFYRDDIAAARLVAGTGCNAATGQYALRPLISAGVIDLDEIVLDLKCAVSGAGRSLKENLLHAELSEGYNAYSFGGTHRHLGEFDQEFSKLAGRPVRVSGRVQVQTSRVEGPSTLSKPRLPSPVPAPLRRLTVKASPRSLAPKPRPPRTSKARQVTPSPRLAKPVFPIRLA